jgi:hypothetical protein
MLMIRINDAEMQHSVLFPGLAAKTEVQGAPRHSSRQPDTRIKYCISV